MNLFSHLETEPTYEELFPGAVLMRGLALGQEDEFLEGLRQILAAAPVRHATTPTGLPMQVMVTNCGTESAFRRWHGRSQNGSQGGGQNGSEGGGRRPLWPPMPRALAEFAIRCGVRAGFPRFAPDSCHVNRYEKGTKLGLHQDRHEFDLHQPIVSVSFGLECVFLLGGLMRTDPTKRILLEHGDVIVWGGPSRMRFHGVLPLKAGSHGKTGPYRYNLTFRRVA